jgi:S1-C subfamily serine protease
MKRGLRPELIVLFMVVVVCYGALQWQIYMSDRSTDSVRRNLGETGQVLAKESESIKKALDTIDSKFVETEAHVTTMRNMTENKTQDVAENVAATRRDLEEKLKSLQELVAENVASTRTAISEISGIKRSICHDSQSLIVETLYPSVKIAGSGGVGAGTIVYSAMDSHGQCHTYLVSAFHVVAGYVTIKDGIENRETVTISIYEPDLQTMTDEVADIIVYDKKADLVLLKLRERGKCFPAAKLASRKELKEVCIFTPVYAVGCPLGHSPLPSAGEISTLNKKVDGKTYWMMNAPTIYGNSGGGVFLIESHQFVGVSAMLCVYQQFINVPVPHMGVLVPATTVYDWLDYEHYQFVYDPAYTTEGCAVARVRAVFARMMGRAARTVFDLFDLPGRGK